MEKFIKYVNIMEPIVNNRRISMHSTMRAFLREQRSALFSSWEKDIFKIIATGRGEHGKFIRKDHDPTEDDEEDLLEQPKKRGPRSRVFDFESLMDKGVSSEWC